MFTVVFLFGLRTGMILVISVEEHSPCHLGWECGSALSKSPLPVHWVEFLPSVFHLTYLLVFHSLLSLKMFVVFLCPSSLFD